MGQGYRVYESRDGGGFSTLQGTFSDIAAMNLQLARSAHPAVGVDIDSGIVVSVNAAAPDDLIGKPLSESITIQADDPVQVGDVSEQAALDPSGVHLPPPPPASESYSPAKRLPPVSSAPPSSAPSNPPGGDQPWYRRRWVWGVAAAVVVVGVNVGRAWWDDRQADQARDELRDLGFDDEAIEEFEEAAEGADDLDENDGSLSDDEIGLARLTVDGLLGDGIIDDLTDDEIRDLAVEVCLLAADADDQSAFFVPFDAYVTESGTGLTFDVARVLAGAVGSLSCNEDVAGLVEDDPMTVGSDPQLDLLLEGCVGGSFADCDMVFIGSPPGSEYEEVGNTCGGRNDPLDGEGCMFHQDDFSELAAIEDQCEAGLFVACDLLFIISPIGSAANEVGNTCGGQRQPSETLGCVDQFGLGSR